MDGRYSVKSGYRCEMKKMQNEEGSTSSIARKLGPEIWKTDIAPKCQNLVWRACHNILRVRQNLIKRGMHIGPMCPWCLEKEETTIHALIGCEGVKRIWFASNVGVYPSSSISNFEAWMSEIIALSNPDFAARVLELIWELWKRRTLWVFS